MISSIRKLLSISFFHARLVLVNAIFFKANWLTKFKKRETKPMKFKVRKGLEINYKYGMNTRSHFNYAMIENLEILELPYKNEDFRMLLILPKEDTNIEDVNLGALDYETLDSKLGNGDSLLQFLKRFYIKNYISLEKSLFMSLFVSPHKKSQRIKISQCFTDSNKFHIKFLCRFGTI